jgi:hypothetical protein
MLVKFSIPKFSEWQLFGKQCCVLFGSTRPLCDIQRFQGMAAFKPKAVA